MNSLSSSIDKLNAAQREAVLHPSGPLLVLAGAGSGKTRVVVQRIAHLLNKGVAHHQIIALTFTNKAAGEMRERLAGLVTLSPWMGTFHSFGLRLLREFSPWVGLDARFVIYDPDDCEKLIKQLLQEEGIKMPPASLATMISLCKNKTQSSHEVKELPGDEDHDALELETFVRLYKRYEEALLACNAVDFDDLLFLSVRLFREQTEVLQELHRRWPYLLIDEYQDTNVCQYEMARLLAGPSRDLFVVGDPDQSIYSWRGADISNILNFERDFPGARVICLEENYRSSPQILAAAAELISNNQHRYEKRLRTTRPSGDPIVLFSAYDDRGEAKFVASEIERLVEKGDEMSEMAVFYRTNFQSRAMEDALRRRNINYRISGGVSFYQRKEIKDILSYLRLCLFDFDRLAFERALATPKRGLGEKTLQKFFAFAAERGLSALQLMQSPDLLKEAGMTPKARTSLAQFGELVVILRSQVGEMKVHEIIAAVIEKIDYMRYLSEQEEGAIERMENLNELIAKAIEWQEYHKEETERSDSKLYQESVSLEELRQAEAQLNQSHLGEVRACEAKNWLADSWSKEYENETVQEELALELPFLANLNQATVKESTPVIAKAAMAEGEGAELLRNFLEEMNLGPQQSVSEESSAVTLMTVHNAKGLEYDTVFIVGLEEMLFPHVNHKGDEGRLEEERRLLYVGMTRARRRLYLSSAQSRFLWGTARSMRPSRFIHELPIEQLSMRKQTYQW